MTVLTVYTLKTCDSCKKAIKWLDAEGIAYENRDVRADGLDAATLANIIAAAGVDKAVNKRSTTWKGLNEEARGALNADTAVTLIAANPTLLKRPAFVIGDRAAVGFDAASQAFAKNA